MGNGSRPCVAYQDEISAMPMRVTLNPPEPNRTVAHSRSGRGAYSNAGLVLVNEGCKPNTTTQTRKVAIPNRPASMDLIRVVFRIQERPFRPQSTTMGTIVSS